MGKRELIAVGLGGCVVWLALTPPVLAQRCGGLLQPACPPPAPAPPPTPHEQATITLSPPTIERNVRGGPIRIAYSGRVTGVSNPYGLWVHIEVRSPDYGLVVDTRDTAINADGTFAARIRTSLNSTVRASIRPDQVSGRNVDGISPVAEIRVRPKRPTLRFVPVGRRSVRFELAFAGPLSVMLPDRPIKTRPGPARRVYFYAVPKGSRWGRLIGSAPLRNRECTGFCVRSARKSFTITRQLLRAGAFMGCARDDVWLGIGDGDLYRSCGQPRLPV